MESKAPTAGQGQSGRRGRRDARPSPPFVSTRRAPTATTAGKRNQALVHARTAANTYEAAGRQNTAGQVVPELAFHETRDRAVPCLLSGEEGLQLFGDDLIQQRRFWIARPVSVDSHEGIAECTSTRNSLHHRFSNFRAGRHGEPAPERLYTRVCRGFADFRSL